MSCQTSTTAMLKFDDNQVPYIDLGNNYVIGLERGEAADWALEKAKRELRESPEIKNQAIKELKELIAKEKNLHLPTDDEYMTMFLRPCKYYAESTMKRIKCYYNLKHKYGYVCDEIYPHKVRDVFENELMSLLPERDQDGRRILVLEAGKKWKPSKVPLDNLFKTVQLLVQASMAEPMTQINGGIVIIDMEGLPLSHIMQFTPNFAAMILEYIQDSILMRLKAVHVVNNSYIFNMLFAIFKPFIREKLRKRIFFHGKDFKELHKHIQKEILPQKYGGTLACDLPPGGMLCDLFECYKKEFEVTNTYGYDEAPKK